MVAELLDRRAHRSRDRTIRNRPRRRGNMKTTRAEATTAADRAGQRSICGSRSSRRAAEALILLPEQRKAHPAAADTAALPREADRTEATPEADHTEALLVAADTVTTKRFPPRFTPHLTHRQEAPQGASCTP
jgi:hypothetical protein